MPYVVWHCGKSKPRALEHAISGSRGQFTTYHITFGILIHTLEYATRAPIVLLFVKKKGLAVAREVGVSEYI